MFTKEYSDTQMKEKIEVFSYVPGLQDSGDLETGTKTITATAEPAGLGPGASSLQRAILLR